MKRTSEYVEQWRKDVPKVTALKPYGMARTNLRFRLVPTNPDSERLCAALYEWALGIGLYTAETTGALRRTRMGYLAYWTAPVASAKVRWLIGTFYLWITATDDWLVERGVPMDEVQRASDDVIRTGGTTFAPSPSTRFFTELRDEIIAHRCEGLLPQIADQVTVTFEAWKQEQRYIKEECLPALPAYLRLRVGNSGLCAALLAQRCEKGLLPHDKRFCERLDRISQLVSVVISLNGDIVGIQKDIEDNYLINVIPVLAVDFGVDLVTAYLMSLDLLDIYKQLFDALVADVCLRPGPEPETAAQALSMAQWLDGFHTWHMTNPRHGAQAVPAAVKAEVNALGDGQGGALLRAVMKRSGMPSSAVATDPERLGATGLGTSGMRLAASLHGAEMLREWAKSLLGWSTPAPPPSSTGDAATPSPPAPARADVQPTGLGISAVRIAASLQNAPAAVSQPSSNLPTGLGTSAARRDRPLQHPASDARSSK